MSRLRLLPLAFACAMTTCLAADPDAPRTPDHDEDSRLVEQCNNPLLEEIYRRRAANRGKPVFCHPLPEIRAASLPEWEAERPRLLKIFSEELYGPVPPPPDRIELKLLAQKDDALGGLAVRREIRLGLHNGGKSFDVDMLLYIPKGAARPAPVFVGLNFSGNHYYGPETDIRQGRGTSWAKGRWHATAAPTATRGDAVGVWNYEEAIRRGYAVATACYGEIFPDNPDGARKSIYTLFQDASELRPDYEIPLLELKTRPVRQFTAVSAWAWGLIQMRRALEQIPEVDAARAIAIGHSRLGKTAIWAAANAPAFAAAVSNNSGHLGAALSKRILGENMLLAYLAHPFWFSGNMVKYVENEGELPVDQHQLLALIAPRGLYVASSSEDEGADPDGEFLAARLAGKVWQLYGKNGLPDNRPPLGQPVGDTLRYHIKKGRHSITRWDWRQYYDFADALFHTRKP